MMHWGNFSGMGFGWIFMLLFWALVILGIAYFVRQLSGGNKSDVHKELAEDVLKKRYAAGEISKEEYKEKSSVIVKQP